MPLAIPPSSSPEGSCRPKVKDEECACPWLITPGPAGLHTHHGSAGQCRWPPDGTARCFPGTGLWGARPPPGTGSRHPRSPACIRSAAHSAAQGRVNCVSADSASWGSCIPGEMGMSLQNASLACWGCDTAVKGHMACPTPTPRQCHTESLACAVCLSFEVHGS